MATYCCSTVSPMDTRRGEETMDHEEAEDTVEGAEETEDNKQCNKEQSNPYSGEQCYERAVQVEESQVDSLRDCPLYCSSLYT